MTAPRKRSVRVSLLIVGEGDAEIAFLQHLRNIYSAEVGRSITLKNAYGGGGHQALKQAIRDVRAWHYNKAAVMIDTDAHWNEADRKEAAKAGIKVVESTPCLEATLLKIAGYSPKDTTPDLKAQFEEVFGCEAHEPRYLLARFGRAVVDAARDNVKELHDLMNHMGIAKRKPAGN